MSRTAVVACLILVLVLGLFWQQQSFVAAQTTPGVNVQIVTPVPVFTMVAVGTTGVDITWNWDFISGGFVPSLVTQVDVEIAVDGGAFGNLQNHPPGDFLASYTGLAAGSYTARVTVIDGNNIQYNLGPVVLSTSGGGRRRGGGGGGGDEGIGGDEVGEGEEEGEAEATDVTISGLAYPGPASAVLVNYESTSQTTIVPSSDGVFSEQTDQYPVGIGTFSFTARDPNNVLSAAVSGDYDVPADEPLLIENIHLPPTISGSSSNVVSGESLRLEGYGYADGVVEVTINGGTTPTVLSVNATGQGRWTVDVDTVVLGVGNYSATAQSTAADEVIVSPLSAVVTFSVSPVVPAAGVCGDGILEAPEACDDGNLTAGDGCDASCELEGELPQTAVNQPATTLFESSDVDLTYRVDAEPNGPVSQVEVYLSRDGGPYEPYTGTFSGGAIQLKDLPDGDYEVYSVGEDTVGFVEQAPSSGDARFTIDVFEDFEVLARPEKRLPATGNWRLASVLQLFRPGSSTASYSYDFTIQADGRGRIDLEEGIAPGLYTGVLKGLSHLSKRIESLDFRNMNGVVLDFTLGGTFALIAGDVHPTKDDFINALDISSIIGFLYGSGVEGDLNRDGIVNALDLSTLVLNLYKRGDGPL